MRKADDCSLTIEQFYALQTMEESYGSTSLRRRYTCGKNGRIQVTSKKSRGFVSISHFFVTVFLPQGYPDSVSEDYLTYQIWDTIQAFASSITGTLAAQAVLKGYGVGDESATVLAATLTWLLKDGTGMLGRILFAWMQGTGLDCDAKRWRLFADIINDAAIFLEIMGPHFPHVFTLILCVSGVLKSIVGVSGGATRAALTQHQARRNNMADVSAKDGSQETLVNLGALICSFILVPIVTGRHALIWVLYFLFTSLHLYANYSAVRGVVMETINQARLYILLAEYFKMGTILSPVVVNKREPVLWRTRRKFDIYLGTSMKSLCESKEDIAEFLDIYKTSRYFLWIGPNRDCINIALQQTASVLDQLEACYHAELINFLQENQTSQGLPIPLQHLGKEVNEGGLSLLRSSREYVLKTFPQFLEDVHQGRWKTDICLLGADEWRIEDQTVQGTVNKM
ncbi:RUS family member 1-like [Mercenaria mercenaria]|uniref:RUS family member 1-like n=1 Tax=Mercenaria mercenaria TaxID=6596 RepID=UPI00234E3F97|nr:RUS family member 1-like [Mercenaria mercenaria]